MTGLARKVIDGLLSADLQAQAVPVLAARGLGDTCVPAAYTGFIAWPTMTGTCTLVYSPDTMLLIAEDPQQEPKLLGAAAYDAKAIEARDWSVFESAGLAA
jgi:hypothetical protein